MDRRTRAVVLAVAITAAFADRAAGQTPSSAGGSGSAEGSANGSGAASLIPAGSGFWHVNAPWELISPSGQHVTMPPAHILADPTWDVLDAGIRSLQEDDTRYKAEDESFRKSDADWKPSWWVIASAVASGIVVGWYAHDKL